MADVQDLYELLGVDHDATPDDIRRAYRQLARELHPDVNPEPGAEERFKQVSAAYEVLSDPQKRQQYDTFGNQSIPDMFPFGDIFDVFFGGGRGRQRRGPRGRARAGEDAFAEISLTLEEAAFGTQREVTIESLEPCQRCSGSGAEPGTAPQRCSRCGGSGELQEVQRSIFGTIMTTRPCPTCEGSGEVVASPCAECRGEGRVRRRQVVTADVPAGVADGMQLRIEGVGNAGRAGGPPGDLYLQTNVRPHPSFERRGIDLHAILDVPLTQAVLGAEVEVHTLDGVERVKLAAGTQPGTVIRLKGQGVPNLGRRGRGDLFLTVQVVVPDHLKRDERQLVERLAESRGEAPRKGEVPEGRLRRPAQ
ncbi:MAG TPA: molecular chaperone DnaJ [Actinomycetota bacterium]|nr:molecular chaperone DnaJ [Actinomycetota bacterium]